LTKFVVDSEIDWKKLDRIVRDAVHFLDNVIDANRYPLKEITAITHANRKIGLGVMGFAEALIMLGVKYDSEEGVAVARRVMGFIQRVSHEASEALAVSRGSFPNFKGSTWSKKGRKMMRNATVTTIAPTGTISIIAGCSSGIEPLFAVSFVRDVMEGTKLLEVNPLLKDGTERGIFSADLLVKIAETGSIQAIAEVPQDIKRLFVTALDISPEWHVRIQSEFQRNTDNAVSKTINLRRDATIDDCEESLPPRLAAEMQGNHRVQIWKQTRAGFVHRRSGKEGGERHVVADSEYAGGCAGSTCPY